MQLKNWISHSRGANFVFTVKYGKGAGSLTLSTGVSVLGFPLSIGLVGWWWALVPSLLNESAMKNGHVCGVGWNGEEEEQKRERREDGEQSGSDANVGRDKESKKERERKRETRKVRMRLEERKGRRQRG